MIDDPARDDLRALFDWRASQDAGEAAAPAPVADDELALALGLLSCNSREREQFRSARP